MRLPKRKETLKAYAARTGIPLEIVRQYQDVRNAQRREARSFFKRLGLPASYGALMPDIRSYTKGGDADFFRSAALSGASWLGSIGDLYQSAAYGYLANLYQLTQEEAPDPDTFDIIGDIIARKDTGEMLRFIDVVGEDAISLIYNPDEESGEISLDFSGLRGSIYAWANGHV